MSSDYQFLGDVGTATGISMGDESVNWDHEAAKTANHAADFRRTDHHGAFSWNVPGVAAVFGNHGYSHSEVGQIAAGLTRQRVRDAGIEELAFAVDTEGDTWAMIARTTDLEFLNNAVTEAWRSASETWLSDLERKRLKQLQAQSIGSHEQT